MKNYKVLGLAILLGFIVHFAAVFGLQYLPIKSERVHTLVPQTYYAKETKMLTEVFEQLVEKLPERVDRFPSLKPEHAPQLEIGIPQKELCAELLALDPAEFDIKSFDEDLVSYKIELKDFLISPSAVKTKLPSYDLALKDDPYDSFGQIAGSEHFDVQVEYAHKRARPGYVFKITFFPRPDIYFRRIAQNYYFLIDRSNSIPKARYALNKLAVSEALSLLKPHDHFNILIFDGHVVRLSREPLLCTENNLAYAREFLERQPHGGHFAATELYASLGKIIPENVSDQEVNTAILLSDGDTFLSIEKQRQTIGKWTFTNQGKVALYAVASGSGNNLTLLDLISSFNKGYLLYCADHGQLFDRLKALISSVQNPIGKEMCATALSADKHMHISLQPKQARLSDLYQHRPFVLYGSTNKLSDFVIFLQGKYYDRRFDIKKAVSFSKAKLGSASIERGWAQAVVQEYYEHYFEDGNISHLEAAKKLLSPLNLPTLFLD